MRHGFARHGGSESTQGRRPLGRAQVDRASARRACARPARDRHGSAWRACESQVLLRRAARSFGPRERVERARCVTAEAEVALASRDLRWPTHALDEARRTFGAANYPFLRTDASAFHSLIIGYGYDENQMPRGQPVDARNVCQVRPRDSYATFVEYPMPRRIPKIDVLDRHQAMRPFALAVAAIGVAT